MEKLGPYFKAQREEKGIRLEEISSITKIHLTQLQLMEDSRWDKLPPEPFIRGFISAYAKYVGLDAQDCIDRYCQETGHSPAPIQEKPSKIPGIENPDQPLEAIRGFPMLKIAAVLGSVVLVGAIIGVAYLGKKASQPDALEVAQTEPIQTQPAQPPPPKAKPEPAPPSAATAQSEAKPEEVSKQATTEEPTDTPPTVAHELIVEGNERSWVKLVVDDKAPREFFLNAGGKLKELASEKIKLIIGNATGAKIYHNGEIIEGREIKPGILYFVFPKGARFPQDIPRKVESKSKSDNEEVDEFSEKFKNE